MKAHGIFFSFLNERNNILEAISRGPPIFLRYIKDYRGQNYCLLINTSGFHEQSNASLSEKPPPKCDPSGLVPTKLLECINVFTLLNYAVHEVLFLSVR